MAVRIITVASSGADWTTWILAEADIPADGTGGETVRAILDEELPGGAGFNASNIFNQELIGEASAATRFTSLTYGSGSRISSPTLSGLGINTNNVIFQDLQIRAVANAQAPVILDAGTGPTCATRRCYLESEHSDVFRVISGSLDPTIAFCIGVLSANAASADRIFFQNGVCKYNLALVIDGKTGKSGIFSGAGGTLAYGNLILGTYATDEFEGTGFTAPSDYNLGKADAAIPGANSYDLDDAGRTKANILAATDGSDCSRKRADAAWNAYTALNATTPLTGEKDILGGDLDLTNLRVGPEQDTSGGGGGEKLNDLEAGSLEVWALVSSMNAGVA